MVNMEDKITEYDAIIRAKNKIKEAVMELEARLGRTVSRLSLEEQTLSYVEEGTGYTEIQRRVVAIKMSSKPGESNWL